MMSEYQIQRELLKWCESMSLLYPGLDRIVHVGNEGKRTGKTIGGLKGSSRFNKGFPDLFLPVPKNGYHGLMIELKTKRGKLSESQTHWLCYLSGEGYRATVCRGLEAAQTEIIGYYEGLV